MKTVAIDSIAIPKWVSDLCDGWYYGSGCMLYAVASTPPPVEQKTGGHRWPPARTKRLFAIMNGCALGAQTVSIFVFVFDVSAALRAQVYFDQHNENR